ncbi:phosphatidylinositol N-acetylglucosaminyltransferase subunit P [Stomoxys calcitrans]|uniref:phosphatidylinositol N-acetylglucosaminyltransferase subunit P n=1 Tax=Stomoxys calcitrans TaxID=35570 RepID=UPI0027E24063|nr:phosphatidylinositol N-acetylglucosaminyltransferase subunit P [Stomoxys calcitrans]
MPEHSPAPTPHRAVYGYSFYLLVITLFIFYVLWALLPTKQFGLSYLPDKYFAVLLPMLVLVGLAFFAFFIYPAINMSLTPDIDAMSSVVDVPLILKGKTKKSVYSWREVQAILDVGNVHTHVGKPNDIDNCKFCANGHSFPDPTEQIATLRFMDLTEVNKSLFK